MFEPLQCPPAYQLHSPNQLSQLSQKFILILLRWSYHHETVSILQLHQLISSPNLSLNSFYNKRWWIGFGKIITIFFIFLPIKVLSSCFITQTQPSTQQNQMSTRFICFLKWVSSSWRIRKMHPSMGTSSLNFRALLMRNCSYGEPVKAFPNIYKFYWKEKCINSSIRRIAIFENQHKMCYLAKIVPFQ